jgi:hypothetical protein
MHDYVRRLVRRIGEAGTPLSRNRHFHTFATPLGRRALKLSRELRSLARDILAQVQDGAPLSVERRDEGEGGVRVLIQLVRLKARRTAYLSQGEWELLLQEEGVRAALERSGSSSVQGPR